MAQFGDGDRYSDMHPVGDHARLADDGHGQIEGFKKYGWNIAEFIGMKTRLPADTGT